MNKNIRFIDLVQGSKEWHDFRKFKLGSSAAASIRGVGFKTPLQLFEDIMEDKISEPNMAMERGTRLEPIAREFLNKKFSSNLQPAVVQHPNPEYDWHISSLDGIWERPDGSIFVCEIKCPGERDHNIALQGSVPEKYLPQLYHILEDLPGVERILYFSYSEDSHAYIWVDRHDLALSCQLNLEKEFYQRMLTCSPPDPIEKDWIEFSGSEVMSKANLYSFVQDQIKDLQEKAETLKWEILERTGQMKRARIGHLKVQKIVRKGNVDYEKIEALKGVDLEPYRKDPITSWRLSS